MKSHVDELRTHLVCGICIRPLYEPFTIACGHTFCYSVSLTALTTYVAYNLTFVSAYQHGSHPAKPVRTAGLQ